MVKRATAVFGEPPPTPASWLPLDCRWGEEVPIDELPHLSYFMLKPRFQLTRMEGFDWPTKWWPGWSPVEEGSGSGPTAP